MLSMVSQKRSHDGLVGEVARGGVSLIEEIEAEWRALAHTSEQREPFLQPEWFRAFATAFQAKSEVVLVTARDNGALKGLLPLFSTRTCFKGLPGRTLRSLSGKHSVRFDLISALDRSRDVSEVVWRTLRNTRGWDVIEALDVPEDGMMEGLLSHAKGDGYLVARWPTNSTPYLELPDGGGDPFAHCPTRHKRTRARLKSYLDKLKSRGEVRLEVVTRSPEEALRRFIELEARGWKGKSGGAIGCGAERVRFYEECVTEAALKGYLRFYTLWVSNTPVAMELGLVMGGTYSAPKCAYDERYANCSPGHLLTRFIIEDIFRIGLKRYDFLGPRARHKTVWAGEIRQHYNIYIFQPSCTGRLRHALVTQFAPVMRRVRHKFRGSAQGVHA
jgi:CelD/BcsL family acetyltransferase involved in cellulose biosynthesis